MFHQYLSVQICLCRVPLCLIFVVPQHYKIGLDEIDAVSISLLGSCIV